MQKIAYITVRTPFSTGETFILTEMLSLKEMGADLLIIPRDRSDRVFHREAEPLLNHTLSIPRLNLKILKACFEFAFMHPLSFLGIFNDAILKARNLKVSFKNFVILPKSIYLSTILKQQSVSHIHAHWASTTSTMAYIASRVSGIPWSFTAHRWDIKENNILREKVRKAAFVRVIDENGRKQVLDIVHDMSLTKKVAVIHMGVNVPEKSQIRRRENGPFIILCPANLVAVKGHKYLIDACKYIVDRGVKFRCFIVGDGPLRTALEIDVKSKNLGSYITFLGKLEHEKLLELYKERMVDLVVLPSIVTEEGEKEGIPVALMEAMAYGIPVISTDTGGIPELLSGAGIIVLGKNAEQLALAIENIMTDTTNSENLQKLGKEKIISEFDIKHNVGILLDKMKESNLSV
jgi:colanic acid/amylovoran biosynthesis glycosyltransferase